jgi:hypothetical protein
MHRHLDLLEPRIQRTGRRRGTIFGEAIQMAAVIKGTHGDEFVGRGIFEFVFGAYDELRDSGTVDGSELADLDVEEVKVATMADLYVARYGTDVRREIEFDEPLRNPITGKTSRAFRIAGKVDGISRTFTKTDGTKVAVIVEDKFVKSIQRAMIQRLPLDAQSTEYVDAFLAKGWDANVLYRHTRYPGMNPKPAKEYKTRPDYPGETLGEFEQRLREDVAENPSSYFDEQELYFPHVHIDDYRNGRWGIAQQILAARREYRKSRKISVAPEITPRLGQVFPMNSTRCWEYGGCQFIPLCTKQQGAEDLYVRTDDNPELSIGKDDKTTSEYGESEGA